MPEDAEGLDRLKEAVPRIVTEFFEKDRRIVLLSNVGQRLRKEGIDFKAILGDVGLATFIRQELSDQVELKSSPDNPKVVAAYPSGVNLSQELDPGLATSKRPILGERPTPTRQYAREIWYAFSHPLEEGKSRFVRLSPALTYMDLTTGEQSEGGIEVPADCIVPQGTAPAFERNKSIVSNIETWAVRHGVSLDEISARPRQRGARSALDVLLQSLSQSELNRVALPLDIIRTLRTKKID